MLLISHFCKTLYNYKTLNWTADVEQPCYWLWVRSHASALLCWEFIIFSLLTYIYFKFANWIMGYTNQKVDINDSIVKTFFFILFKHQKDFHIQFLFNVTYVTWFKVNRYRNDFILLVGFKKMKCFTITELVHLLCEYCTCLRLFLIKRRQISFLTLYTSEIDLYRNQDWSL